MAVGDRIHARDFRVAYDRIRGLGIAGGYAYFGQDPSRGAQGHIRVYRLTSTGGVYDSARSFPLPHATHHSPYGVGPYDQYLYVADANGSVYCYLLSSMGASRQTAREFSPGGLPRGLAINEDTGTAYLVKLNDSVVAAWTVHPDSPSANTDLNFDLDSDNSAPQGITIIDGVAYVLDRNDNKAYAYVLTDSGANYDSTKDISFAGLGIVDAAIAHDENNRIYVMGYSRGASGVTVFEGPAPAVRVSESAGIADNVAGEITRTAAVAEDVGIADSVEVEDTGPPVVAEEVGVADEIEAVGGHHEIVIDLLASWFVADSSHKRWTAPAGSRPVIPSAFLPPGQGVTYYATVAVRYDNRLIVHFESVNTGSGFETPRDLSNAFETMGSLSIEANGERFDFNVADADNADSEEPYAYTLSGDVLARMAAFRDQLGTISGQQAGRLTIRDAPVPVLTAAPADGVGVADTPVAAMTYRDAMGEGIGVAETVEADEPPRITEPVSEAAGVADSVEAGITGTGNVEGIGIADSFDVAMGLDAVVTEGIGVADSGAEDLLLAPPTNLRATSVGSVVDWDRVAAIDLSQRDADGRDRRIFFDNPDFKETGKVVAFRRDSDDEAKTRNVVGFRTTDVAMRLPGNQSWRLPVQRYMELDEGDPTAIVPPIGSDYRVRFLLPFITLGVATFFSRPIGIFHKEITSEQAALIDGTTTSWPLWARNLAEDLTPGPSKIGDVVILVKGSVSEARTWDGTDWIRFELVGESLLVTGGVTTPKLAAQVVTAQKIKALAIMAEHIASRTITAGKIVANALTAQEIAAAAIGTAELTALAVTAAKIATGTITALQLAAGSVSTAELIANAVTAAKIAANTITAAEIAANAIQASELAANAVTATKISAGAVTASKIAAGVIPDNFDDLLGQIDGSDIENAAITSAKIASLAVTTLKLAANAVTAAKIAANTITAAEIAANAIQASELAANAVTATKISAGAVTASKIAAGVIPDISDLDIPSSFSDLAGQIDSADIAAGAVIASKIATGVIGANHLAVNSITAGKIMANSITAAKINGGAVTTTKIADGATTEAKLDSGVRSKLLEGAYADEIRFTNKVTDNESLHIGDGTKEWDRDFWTDITGTASLSGTGGQRLEMTYGKLNITLNQVGPCFAPWQPVLLASGLSCPASAVEIGEMVATPNGPREVVALSRLYAHHDMIEVLARLVLEGGEEILCTPNHGFRLAKGGWGSIEGRREKVGREWSPVVSPDGVREKWNRGTQPRRSRIEVGTYLMGLNGPVRVTGIERFENFVRKGELRNTTPVTGGYCVVGGVVAAGCWSVETANLGTAKDVRAAFRQGL